jgi:hypothetical protein
MQRELAYVVVLRMAYRALVVTLGILLEHTASKYIKHPADTYFGLQWPPGASKFSYPRESNRRDTMSSYLNIANIGRKRFKC